MAYDAGHDVRKFVGPSVSYPTRAAPGRRRRTPVSTAAATGRAPRPSDEPDRRPRARPMARAERRAQILACALAETAARGLGHARHSDVARAAGVAVPTVFHYFRTREDLAASVIAEVERLLFEDIVEPCFASAASAPEALTGILLAFADAIDTHPDHVRVWLGWSTAVDGAFWPDYLRFYARALEYVGDRIEAGKREGTLDPRLDTGDEARVIVGLAHVIAQMKFANQARAAIERTVRFVVDGYVLGGIARRGVA